MVVFGGMIPSPPWPIRYLCSLYSHTNLGDIEGYRDIAEAEAEAVARISRVSLGREYPGKMTSGATESNILALYYWRETGKRKVAVTSETHYSIVKAAKLLGMKIEEYDPRIVGSDHVVVATIGTTEYGRIDIPVEELAKARSRGAAIHIDAAYAGPIARYLVAGLEVEISSLEATYTVDFHKIPEAPPPAGALIAFDEKVLIRLKFHAPYLPGGYQFGLLGTRPGCSAIAAREAMRLVVESWPGGPRGLAVDLHRLAESISAKARGLGYSVEGGPMPIRCLIPPNTEWRDRLASMGVKFYTCGKGRGLRFVAMPHHIWEGYGWMLDLLEKVV